MAANGRKKTEMWNPHISPIIQTFMKGAKFYAHTVYDK